MKLFFCFIFIFPGRVFLQTNPDSVEPPGIKSNMEVFYLLADSSAGEAAGFVPENYGEIILKLNLGNNYSILGNQIVSYLQNRHFTVSQISDGKDRVLLEGSSYVNFVIDNAHVEYGEMFRDGFLGDYYIPRLISLSGNFTINISHSKYNSFNFTSIDTVKVDQIKNLENSSFPFTQGEIPSEPFFAGILEPVIAVGTAAVAVFLFFTIRSR